MRIVFTEQNETVRADAELGISYTCPKCKTEFTFKVDRSEQNQLGQIQWKPSWTDCPVCHHELALKKREKAEDPETSLLREAVALYQGFYALIERPELSLKLVVMMPGTKPPNSAVAQ
jgi:uncharacterized protein YbaR (Trm112 family)